MGLPSVAILWAPSLCCHPFVGHPLLPFVAILVSWRTENFESFSDAMLTLFQCFTLDSAGQVYRPLITHNPVLMLGCILKITAFSLDMLLICLFQFSLRRLAFGGFPQGSTLGFALSSSTICFVNSWMILWSYLLYTLCIHYVYIIYSWCNCEIREMIHTHTISLSLRDDERVTNLAGRMSALYSMTALLSIALHKDCILHDSHPRHGAPWHCDSCFTSIALCFKNLNMQELQDFGDGRLSTKDRIRSSPFWLVSTSSHKWVAKHVWRSLTFEVGEDQSQSEETII